jgi:two-component system, response regulator YesN
LQLLTDSRVDLLITDIRLPGRLHGIALARAVKQSWPNVKIVIVSFGLDQFALKDLRTLADGVLTKPFKLSELEERVANLIG